MIIRRHFTQTHPHSTDLMIERGLIIESFLVIQVTKGQTKYCLVGKRRQTANLSTPND